MVNSNFNDVGDFHRRFGLHAVNHDGWGPEEVSEELMKFRIKFMEEELQEFRDGYNEQDHAQMFDALLDLAYVVFGTAHMLGYPWQQGWDLVQMANMRKVRAAADGSNSKRGSSLDVVKPDGWEAPGIGALLEKYGWPPAPPKEKVTYNPPLRFVIPGTNIEVGKSARDMIDRAFANGEPVFVLRAKDIFSLPAMYHYLEQVEKYGPADEQFNSDVQNIILAMKNWQKNNISKVRYPD